MNEIAVETRDLGVRYDRVVALRDVTLTIPAGRMTGLVGVNGSGKSSFMGALIGTVNATGSVRIFGQSPVHARRASVIAYVPQSEQVDWEFPVTVRDVVMMGRFGRMNLLRRASAADRRAVDAAIERLGLTSLRDRSIGELSGGQRKRAFVARGLAQDAKLLLLDEPFAGVDRQSAGLMMSVLEELRDQGSSILISDHDLASVRAHSDEVVLFRNRVLFVGSPAEALSPERIEAAFGGDREDAA